MKIRKIICYYWQNHMPLISSVISNTFSYFQLWFQTFDKLDLKECGVIGKLLLVVLPDFKAFYRYPHESRHNGH